MFVAGLSPFDFSIPIDLSGDLLAAAEAVASAFMSSVGRRTQETGSGEETSDKVDNWYTDVVAVDVDPISFSTTINLGFIHSDLHVAIFFDLEERTDTTDPFAVSLRIEPRGNSTWSYGLGTVALSLPDGSESAFNLATVLQQAQSAEALAGAQTELDWQLATNFSVDYRFIAGRPLRFSVDLDLLPSGWTEPTDFVAGCSWTFSDRWGYPLTTSIPRGESVPCLYDGRQGCERRTLLDATTYAAYNGSRLDSSLQYEDRDSIDYDADTSEDQDQIWRFELTPSNIDGKSRPHHFSLLLSCPIYFAREWLRLSPVFLPFKYAQALQRQSASRLKLPSALARQRRLGRKHQRPSASERRRLPSTSPCWRIHPLLTKCLRMELLNAGSRHPLAST